MIEFRIWLPPINLWSKPWQHEFDRLTRTERMKKRNHDALRLYWLRAGKPQLWFKYGDDPWIPVQGEPSFNPAFEYSLRADDMGRVMSGALYVEDETKPDTDTYEYKRGYKQALDDVRTEAERLANNRVCDLKSST